MMCHKLTYCLRPETMLEITANQELGVDFYLLMFECRSAIVETAGLARLDTDSFKPEVQQNR